MASSSTPVVAYEYRDTYYYYTRFPGTKYYTHNNLKSNAVVKTNTKNGTSLPGWKSLIATGQNAGTAYTRTEYKPFSTFVGASSYTKEPGFPGAFIVSTTQQLLHPRAYPIMTHTDTELSNRALTSLKNKLRQQTGAFNALVPLGEMKDLRGLVRNSAALTTNLVSTLLAIKRTKGKSARQYASQAWLNYSFGINPLINQTKQAAESINKFLGRQGNTLRLTGTATRSWVERVAPNNVGSCTTYSTLSYHGSHRYTLSYHYIAGIGISLTAGNAYTMANNYSLNVSGLLPVLWELTPYSWIVDYFTNVGEFLDDRFSSSPGNTIYCIGNRRLTATTRLNVYATCASDTVLTNSSFGQNGVDAFDFSRSVLSSLPHVGLTLRSLDSVGMNSVNKLLNLTSLLLR